MNRYELTAKLNSSACFSQLPALGNNYETLPYIPGTTVRGMFAAEYIKKQTTKPPFEDIFRMEAVLFPDLLPASGHHVPLSAYTCKRYPGFRADSGLDQPRHGVINPIFEDLINEPIKQCPTCGAFLQPLSREGAFYSGNASGFISLPVKQQVSMHTAVDTASGSARRGSLYSQKELVRGQIFSGNILINDEKAFASLIARVGEGFTAYGGRRREGELTIRIDESYDDPDPERIYTFASHPNKIYCILSFTSDVILVDHFLRPVTALTASNLGPLLAPPNGVELLRSFAAERTVPGWHGVGRMPKEDDWALVAGSTFLLASTAADIPALHDWMASLTAGGVGLRRSEGFGRVSFGEPFHDTAYRRIQDQEELWL